VSKTASAAATAVSILNCLGYAHWQQRHHGCTMYSAPDLYVDVGSQCDHDTPFGVENNNPWQPFFLDPTLHGRTPWAIFCFAMSVRECFFVFDKKRW
jgi:hypothetical protein